jgi:16S rRNA (guanine527-N7)-methyltransferase
MMNWQDSLAREYSLEARHLASLETLLGLLLERSDRNLTAVTSSSGIVNVHFRDSLSLLEFPEVARAATAVDIGSGGGFPGLPLAILRSDLHVTLLESNRRKCAFIQEAIDSIGLGNAETLCIRAEDAARGELRDYFDVSFARAVGSLPVSLEYTLPLVKTGGWSVLQRGALLKKEKELATSVSGQLNGSFEHVIPVKPYPEANNLHVWFFSKNAATPEIFPRKPGLAKKRPLE